MDKCGFVKISQNAKRILRNYKKVVYLWLRIKKYNYG